MDIGAIFLLFIVMIAAVLFVARPFIQNRRIQALSTDDQQLSALLAERDRLITALQELDFDHTLGKIPAEDYPATRAGLMQHAAEVLRKLDTFQAQFSGPADDAEDRIEAVIAVRRADAAVGKTASVVRDLSKSDDDLETLIASRKAARKEKSAGFCPQCGKAIQRSDRFCPHCGKRIL
jgi:NADH pyrophosphatase NudC (nudix superfamily)